VNGVDTKRGGLSAAYTAQAEMVADHLETVTNEKGKFFIFRILIINPDLID
jgi:hypothetical protein